MTRFSWMVQLWGFSLASFKLQSLEDPPSKADAKKKAKALAQSSGLWSQPNHRCHRHRVMGWRKTGQSDARSKAKKDKDKSSSYSSYSSSSSSHPALMVVSYMSFFIRCHWFLHGAGEHAACSLMHTAGSDDEDPQQQQQKYLYLCCTSRWMQDCYAVKRFCLTGLAPARNAMNQWAMMQVCGSVIICTYSIY